MRNRKMNDNSDCVLNVDKSYGQNEKPFMLTEVESKLSTVVREPSFIDIGLVERTFTGYNQNNFIKFLFDLFGTEITNQVLNKYRIGSSLKWPGLTIFWQIDRWGNVRSGRIILYNCFTGKRNKSYYPSVRWVHELLDQSDYNFVPCFFGGNQLYEFDKPVAIVHDDASACISSIYVPKYIWIASSGISQLNVEKCRVLKGRKVVLYPPLGGYERWAKIAARENFEISDYLERVATDEERRRKLDISDYLLSQNYEEFRLATENPLFPKNGSADTERIFHSIDFLNEEFDKQWWKIPNEDDLFELSKPIQPKPPKEIGHSKEFRLKKCDIPVPKKILGDIKNWEVRIQKMEYTLSYLKLPAGPFQLNSYTKIIDLPEYVKNELYLVKTCVRHPVHLSSLERLEEVLEILKKMTLN
jgi:hypothetical protein